VNVIDSEGSTGPLEKPDTPKPNFEEVPVEFFYTDELQAVLQFSAAVGGNDIPPINYSRLVIALLASTDRESRWLQTVFEENLSTIKENILRQSKLDEASLGNAQSLAVGLSLVPITKYASVSARKVLSSARDIAQEIQGKTSSATRDAIEIDVRHLIAAIAFRNPANHDANLSRWGIDKPHMQREFALLVNRSEFSKENWSVVGVGVTLSKQAEMRGSLIGGFTADEPGANNMGDLLGVDTEARAFARIVAAKNTIPPLAIGIFGEWGSGKTFFMRRVHDLLDEFEKNSKNEDVFHTNIVQIRFNAWHYIESNLWASLVEFIFAELDAWILERNGDSRLRSDDLFSRLSTAQKLKLDSLEEVIACRAQRTSAEQRLEKARDAYEQALDRASGLDRVVYSRVLLEKLLESAGADEIKQNVNQLGSELGLPHLARNAASLLEVLEDAKLESGRAKIKIRAGVSRLGTLRWICGMALILLVFPFALAFGSNALAELFNASWFGGVVKGVNEVVLGLSGVLATLTAAGGILLRHASKVLNAVDDFEKGLYNQIQEQQRAVHSGDVANNAATAEQNLVKKKQSLLAAERALQQADSKLTEARNEFENATARSRLNAFIRAKVTNGEYGKHLGIIASIRRDFSQLASLLTNAQNNADEERSRLEQQMRSGVTRFFDNLKEDANLTRDELINILALLNIDESKKVLNERKDSLSRWLGGDDEFNGVRAELNQRIDPTQNQTATISRIVLYIDDLDRCPPKVVVDVLQAVHLLLSFPLFTVFVAVDARWISMSLSKEYPNLLLEDSNGDASKDLSQSGGATAQDYLEKIFQIPYWVRPINQAGAKGYVETLLSQDRRPDRATQNIEERKILGKPPGDDGSVASGGNGNQGEAGSELKYQRSLVSTEPESEGLKLDSWEIEALALFAQSIGGTPRRLIRFINLYRLLKTAIVEEQAIAANSSINEDRLHSGLIVQLAIVTAAPHAAASYYKILESEKHDVTLTYLAKNLKEMEIFHHQLEHERIWEILTAGKKLGHREPTGLDLRKTALAARRFSFIASNEASGLLSTPIA
jgi:KAP family P-loop domain